MWGALDMIIYIMYVSDPQKSHEDPIDSLEDLHNNTP